MKTEFPKGKFHLATAHVTFQGLTFGQKFEKSGKCVKRTFCDISVKIVSNVNLTHHIL